MESRLANSAYLSPPEFLRPVELLVLPDDGWRVRGAEEETVAPVKAPKSSAQGGKRGMGGCEVVKGIRQGDKERRNK